MWNTSKDTQFQTKTFYFGEVISIDDNTGSGKIMVRIEELDKNIPDSSLAPCYPLFNFQFFRVLPKVGERVSVFLDRVYSGDKTINQEKRYWNGISISQPNKISFDPYHYTASSHESDGWAAPENLASDPESLGVNPDPEDMAIRGRENTDILFKDNELVLRAGRHRAENPLKFNEVDPAFVQIKYRNKTNAINTKVIEVLQEIPADHIIKASANGYSYLIKVILKQNNSIAHKSSGNGVNVNDMLVKVRQEIFALQRQFPKWELRTDIDGLMDIPVIYPNNTVVTKQRVLDNEQKTDRPSVINVVADKLNFLSHLTNNNDLTDNEQVISDETIEDIEKNAERMVKGDSLIGFLKLVRTYLNNHVHPYANMAPVQEQILQKINNFNLEQLVNDNIRLG